MIVNEQIDKLTQAKSLVEEVRKSWRLESNECPHCGLTKYTNFGQFQANDTLGAVLSRLEKTIDRMNREPEIFEDVPE